MSEEKPKKRQRLNVRQTRFVAEVASGKPVIQSYADVYTNGVVSNSTGVLAHRNLNKPHIQEGIREFMERKYPNLKDTVGKVLSDILENPETRVSDKLKTIALIGDYFGWKAPSKSQHLTATIDASKFRLPGSEDE